MVRSGGEPGGLGGDKHRKPGSDTGWGCPDPAARREGGVGLGKGVCGLDMLLSLPEPGKR